jgi:hypothetical protein
MNTVFQQTAFEISVIEKLQYIDTFLDDNNTFRLILEKANTEYIIQQLINTT